MNQSLIAFLTRPGRSQNAGWLGLVAADGRRRSRRRLVRSAAGRPGCPASAVAGSTAPVRRPAGGAAGAGRRRPWTPAAASASRGAPPRRAAALGAAAHPPTIFWMIVTSTGANSAKRVAEPGARDRALGLLELDRVAAGHHVAGGADDQEHRRERGEQPGQPELEVVDHRVQVGRRERVGGDDEEDERRVGAGGGKRSPSHQKSSFGSGLDRVRRSRRPRWPRTGAERSSRCARACPLEVRTFSGRGFGHFACTRRPAAQLLARPAGAASAAPGRGRQRSRRERAERDAERGCAGSALRRAARSALASGREHEQTSPRRRLLDLTANRCA